LSNSKVTTTTYTQLLQKTNRRRLLKRGLFASDNPFEVGSNAEAGTGITMPAQAKAIIVTLNGAGAISTGNPGL
jgi:hypothetical protein